MAQGYFLQSPEKGVSWKFWLDPRFPRDPKLKWILKRLPLDRGCFKSYFFTKGESSLIILCHTSLLTRSFIIFISSRVCITMHVMKLEWSMALDYYFTISRKKGPVKILVRSSIFPRFQNKMNFKVSASR